MDLQCGDLVKPRTFFIGCTTIDRFGLEQYLRATNNEDFFDSMRAARVEGLSDGEILCSFMAKLCYKSLTLGQNVNIQRVRDIPNNLRACFDAGHSSVFGHCQLNFVTTDCSRVFTHELVRNHVGTEFSQTSGRYVRLDRIDLVLDPVLEQCRDLIRSHLEITESLVYQMECRLGLRVPNPSRPNDTPEACFVIGRDWRSAAGKWVPSDKMSFDLKKKLTSAIRRIAPNGQSNEIGWSINLRALRHVIQMRTSRHAEWEIRYVFNQVYDLVKSRFPLIFADARAQEVNGLLEVTGMRTQPYQPRNLDEYSPEELHQELERRKLATEEEERKEKQ
ncbi:MAG: FAD-dependent thymidylate synthase [Acidobacteria bacterium]|nr:FAD-dependent thymidylate synthase [Acidobacteriota bacterium]